MTYYLLKWEKVNFSGIKTAASTYFAPTYTNAITKTCQNNLKYLKIQKPRCMRNQIKMKLHIDIFIAIEILEI